MNSLEQDDNCPNSFESALEKTGFGKFNVGVILICSLGIFAVFMELFSVGYVLPAAECDLELTSISKGVLSSINFIGLIGSSFVWGYLADSKGRKKIIIVSFVLAFAFSGISTMMSNFWGFTFMRLLSGIFIAGPSATILAYCAEFHSVKYRSLALAFVSFFGGVSMIALPYLAWNFLSWNLEVAPFGFIFHSWRLYVVFCSIPSLMVAACLCFLPETPTYLYCNGQKTQVIAVLEKMYALNTGKLRKEFRMDFTMNEKQTTMDLNTIKAIFAPLKCLFKVPHLKYRILLVCALQFGLFSVSSGLFLWYPNILNILAQHGDYGVTVCDTMAYSGAVNFTRHCPSTVDPSVFKGNIIFGVTYTVSCLGWCVLSNIFSNKAILVVYSMISGSCMIALHWINSNIYINAFYVIILALPGVGNAIVNTLSVDMFPTNICATAICISMTAGRIGSVISSLFAGVLLETNCTVTLSAYAFVLIGCSLLSLFITTRSSK